jgi:hypothetical protein
MSTSSNEARSIVESHLQSQEAQMNSDGTIPRALHLIVVREEERMNGWIYFYDTKEHIIDGDVTCALAGNVPYFVNREDGSIDIISAEMLDELREKWRKDKGRS